jgi:hypothetical protein
MIWPVFDGNAKFFNSITYFMDAPCLLNLWVILLPGTRLAVTLRGDEPEEQLELLKNLDLIMVLQYLPEGDEKSSRVHASRR